MKFIICYSLGNSSVSGYFSAIVKELYRRGHDIIVVTWGRDSTSKANALRFPSRRPTKLADFLFMCRLIKKQKPDCIIANFASVNICMIASWLFGVKNRCVYLHTLSTQLYIDSGYGFYQHFQRFRKILVLRLATHCFVNSNAMKENANLVYKICLSKIHIFNLLIKSIKTIDKQRRNNQISFVGRFDPSKGQEDLIQALPIIVERGFNPYVVFLGNGPQLEKCKALAERLGVKQNCDFKGVVSLDEVYDVLQKSIVMVSGSRYEAYGLTNVESISVGTPVVTTGVDGIKEIIIDGLDGLHYNLGDYDDLANKIIVLLANQVKWHQLSQTAKLLFRECFSIEHNIPKHVDRYQELFNL